MGGKGGKSESDVDAQRFERFDIFNVIIIRSRFFVGQPVGVFG